MNEVQNNTEIQVKLDRCTGMYAARIRSAALTMEYSYTRLDGYRAAVIAACAVTLLAGCPEALHAFNQVARIERTIQVATQTYWNLQQIKWYATLSHGCDLPFFSYRKSFPPFNYEVIKEGVFSIGDLKASAFAQAREPMAFEIRNGNLVSRAEIRKRGLNAWQILWAR